MRLEKFAAVLLAGLPLAVMAQQPATLTIDTAKPIAAVSPTLYGLMTEEINYSYDGGLYAELVNNRTFQSNRGPSTADWTILENGDARATMAIDKTTGPSEALPLSLKLTVDTAAAKSEAGIVNSGYWGIPVRPSEQYHGSFYAKTDSVSIGAVTIRIINNDTGATEATATVPTLSTEWKRYEYTLKTGAVTASAANHLTLSVEHPGTAWFSLVSLFPPTYQNTPNGNRIDLMQKLAAMHPAFLRFPGGNYLEGDHINERYEWKKTIGSLVDRPTHPSPWNYHSSDGLGLLEFFEWCEDLHMQPLLAVYAGYSMRQEHVDAGVGLEPYVQDALDEIEYATGSTSTKWGAIRAKDGHPAPFHINYIEVGNEDWFDKSGSYSGRYAQFYKAIKAAYPDIQIIATAPVTGIRADVVDDHFYRSAQEFFNDVHHYDKTDRNGPKVMVGEWVTREGSPTTNMGAALGDAAWMTGMERNSDIVVLASYAPLFVNVNPGGMQWPSDLIGYDALNSYGSPSYYAQAMFSTHLGDHVLDSKLDATNPRLFDSVTVDSKHHRVIVKLVNGSSQPQAVSINLSGAKVHSNAHVTTLGAPTTEATNSITDPTRIVPVVSTISNAASTFTHTVPRYSIQILDLDLN
ncbi:MAG: alpha-L-arabinofuranosidase C-terminal domain-containing protein [Edaphobacter sp.]|uniref:alpha-L-arabinofuranosidase C-terminal domain-containing protein n=1 Tax=Edaphobacter sp. TaxID=1934404 RepID=UPI0029824E4A|nr:alpha-L-arabinofuranosidase C-terminal domain-containing protein [Edaphobacter sp.]MDW5264345.1 alpha-L-arabinofuranosidase C-terminal domain-containing protein [Edaphobacter sp.]